MLPKLRHLYLFIIIMSSQIVLAQELAPCGEREYIVDFPRISSTYFCQERPIISETASDFTSIVFDDDSNLYATHPLRGQIVKYEDSNGDNMPDTPTILAEDLAYPHGITLHDDTLYIMGDGSVYTYSLVDETLITLIDDLPSGRSFLARAITIHADQLYLGIPSPCDFCEADSPLHGTVLRYDLDGTNQQIMARGLRYPTALHFYEERLWVADSARDAYTSDTHYDELNTIDLTSDTVPHFGFPYCVGNNEPDFISENFNCATDAISPTIRIQTNATPFSMTTYNSDTVSQFTDDLLVGFFGSTDSSYVAGHSLLAVSLDDTLVNYHTITPSDDTITLRMVWQAPQDAPLVMSHSALINARAGGIWSYFLYDVAVSPEGWIYYSLGGGGIYVLRER